MELQRVGHDLETRQEQALFPTLPLSPLTLLSDSFVGPSPIFVGPSRIGQATICCCLPPASSPPGKPHVRRDGQPTSEGRGAGGQGWEGNLMMLRRQGGQPLPSPGMALGSGITQEAAPYQSWPERQDWPHLCALSVAAFSAMTAEARSVAATWPFIERVCQPLL